MLSQQDLPPSSKLYHKSLALFCDLYQLTMACGYWKKGIDQTKAVFYFTYRKWPFQGGFGIFAGLGSFLEFFQEFRFLEEDLAYLASLESPGKTPLFPRGFLEYLASLRLTLSIDGMEEGSLVFPYEPLLRVEGPLLQAQILETALLNIFNFQTLIASKAARVKWAASSDEVVEFGMRRAQGIDGAISASRAAMIGGCDATSNVLAGKLFSIPVRGTMSHSWVMAFREESEAFASFVEISPKSAVFLVDTYDTIRGVENAIHIAKQRKKEGFSLFAVRLDSGDLLSLSRSIRTILDRAGFSDTKIMASNELDEFMIEDLKRKGAKISIWGVGTSLVTGKDQPAFDGVYKLSACQNEAGEWVDKMKLSDDPMKRTLPGILQVARYFDGQTYQCDEIYDKRVLHAEDSWIHHPTQGTRKRLSSTWEKIDLFVPLVDRGVVVYPSCSISTIKKRVAKELSRLPERTKALKQPDPYFVGISSPLFEKRNRLVEEVLL